ncbi:hypothetical protein [Methylomonas albis]|uniref:Uncharacterized protein n=1 Tax=Methylomonas albis TaxID=1854563 RepID=A0ABR9CWL7_9GAMM|nr:hypothetical protein [Methylomonas albis]MBD9355110.1 hypothetical protein [Methylomonas albis]
MKLNNGVIEAHHCAIGVFKIHRSIIQTIPLFMSLIKVPVGHPHHRLSRQWQEQIYVSESSTPLVVHSAAGHLSPPIQLPKRTKQNRRSRLVLITISNPKRLANESLIHFGAERSQNQIRMH